MIYFETLSEILVCIYDSLLFAMEWTAFFVIILALYKSIMILLGHVKDILIVFGVIFITHLTVVFFSDGKADPAKK